MVSSKNQDPRTKKIPSNKIKKSGSKMNAHFKIEIEISDLNFIWFLDLGSWNFVSGDLGSWNFVSGDLGS